MKRTLLAFGALLLLLFSGAARAQTYPCPQTISPRLVPGSSYTVTTADMCWLIIFTSASTVTVKLPSPGLIFPPSFKTTLLPINGATLTLSGLPDDAGRVHEVNGQPSLTLAEGAGAVMQIQEDYNWYALPTGGISFPPIPDAHLLGGSAGAFVAVTEEAPLLVSGGALSVEEFTPTTSGIVPASGGGATNFLRADGTWDAPPSCGNGLDLGTVLFANGTTGCTGDAARLFWDTTANTSHGHNLEVTGGDLSGWTVSIESDQLGGWDPNLSQLRLGNNNSDPSNVYGQIQTFDHLGNPARTAINPGGGTVSVGSGSSIFGLSDPIALSINTPANSGSWLTAWASGLAFRGGVFNKLTGDADSSVAELHLYRGATERARISADNTGSSSFVQNRFSAAGLTDTTILSCNGTNSAIQTDGSGNQVCGAISGGGGGVTASGTLTTHAPIVGNGASSVKAVAALTNGQLPIGSTGADPVPSTITAGAGVTITNGAGSITIASAGGGAGNGFLQPIMSAVPTQAGTGLSTNFNLGTAAVTDGPTGFQVCGATNAGQIEGVHKTAPATPYAIDIVLQSNTTVGNAGFGAMFGWDDGTKLHAFMIQTGSSNNPTVSVLRYATTGSGAGAAGVDAQMPSAGLNPATLRIKNDGTTIFFQIDPAGNFNNPQTLYSVAVASGYLSAYTNIFFGINANNGLQCGTLMSYAER